MQDEKVAQFVDCLLSKDNALGVFPEPYKTKYGGDTYNPEKWRQENRKFKVIFGYNGWTL